MVRKLVSHGLVVTSLALGGTALLAPSAAAVDMTVRVISLNGSGCPTGTVSVMTSGSALRLTYSSFLAEFGPDTPQTDYRRNCQATLRVTGPSGSRYAVRTANRSGYLVLPSNASATEKFSTYLSGQSGTVFTRVHSGPMDRLWSNENSVTPTVWSNCDTSQYLNVNEEARVTRGGAAARATGTMSVQQPVLYLLWQTC